MKTADTAKDRADMVMKMMDTKTKMTLPAMITKNMAKTMKDIAMVTVDTVMIRADMATETVDTVIIRGDMAMETVDMEEVTDIQTIQAQRTVIKVIPLVTHQDPL